MKHSRFNHKGRIFPRQLRFGENGIKKTFDRTGRENFFKYSVTFFGICRFIYFTCMVYFYFFIKCITFKYVCCGGFWRPIFRITQTKRTQKSQFEQSDIKLNNVLNPANIKVTVPQVFEISVPPVFENQMMNQTENNPKVSAGIS